MAGLAIAGAAEKLAIPNWAIDRDVYSFARAWIDQELKKEMGFWCLLVEPQRQVRELWEGGTSPSSGGIYASRVVRGAVIGVKENAYFAAAEMIGSTKWKTLIRHVLPNIAAPVIIIFSINIGGVIMSEASLSFLGFGLPPQVPSRGGMLSREGRQYMEMAPWLALWPGLCLTLTVYGLNIFGDVVRDLLDPRLRGATPLNGRRGRLGAPGSR